MQVCTKVWLVFMLSVVGLGVMEGMEVEKAAPVEDSSLRTRVHKNITDMRAEWVRRTTDFSKRYDDLKQRVNQLLATKFQYSKGSPAKGVKSFTPSVSRGLGLKLLEPAEVIEDSDNEESLEKKDAVDLLMSSKTAPSAQSESPDISLSLKNKKLFQELNEQVAKKIIKNKFLRQEATSLSHFKVMEQFSGVIDRIVAAGKITQVDLQDLQTYKEAFAEELTREEPKTKDYKLRKESASKWTEKNYSDMRDIIQSMAKISSSLPGDDIFKQILDTLLDTRSDLNTLAIEIVNGVTFLKMKNPPTEIGTIIGTVIISIVLVLFAFMTAGAGLNLIVYFYAYSSGSHDEGERRMRIAQKVWDDKKPLISGNFEGASKVSSWTKPKGKWYQW